jgi:hypothetical protein
MFKYAIIELPNGQVTGRLGDKNDQTLTDNSKVLHTGEADFCFNEGEDNFQVCFNCNRDGENDSDKGGFEDAEILEKAFNGADDEEDDDEG